MKSLLLARELLQADQHLFKHSKVAHMEQSIKTAVEVIEVWNKNSFYEITWSARSADSDAGRPTFET